MCRNPYSGKWAALMALEFPIILINLFYRQLVCHQCLSQDPHLESGDTDLPFSRSGEIAEALPIEHVASDRGPLGPEI